MSGGRPGDEDLVTVAHPRGEIDRLQVGSGGCTAGRGEGIGDPGPGREADEPGICDGARHVHGDRGITVGPCGHRGRRRRDASRGAHPKEHDAGRGERGDHDNTGEARTERELGRDRLSLAGSHRSRPSAPSSTTGRDRGLGVRQKRPETSPANDSSCSCVRSR